MSHLIGSNSNVAATPETEVEPAAELASAIELESLDVEVPPHRGPSAQPPARTTAIAVAAASGERVRSCCPETLPQSATPVSLTAQRSPQSPSPMPERVEVEAARTATEAARLGAFSAAERHVERVKKTGGHKRRASQAFLPDSDSVVPRGGVDAVAGAAVLTAAEVEKRQVTWPLVPGRAASSPSLSLRPLAALPKAPISDTTNATTNDDAATTKCSTTTESTTTNITDETAEHASAPLLAAAPVLRPPVSASGQAERQAVKVAGGGDDVEASESFRRIAAELPRDAQEAFCMQLPTQLSQSEAEEAEAEACLLYTSPSPRD